MKKIISFSTVLLLICCVMSSFALADVDAHWANQSVQILIRMGAINGYEDGTFKPDQPMRVGEFLKVYLTMLGHPQEINTTHHWATNYYNKAVELELIQKNDDDFMDLDKNVTRGMLARAISPSVNWSFDDLDEYHTSIVDYKDIAIYDQLSVLHVYRAGVMTGFADGKFKVNQTSTRAEISTILVRLKFPRFRKDMRYINDGVDYTVLSNTIRTSELRFEESWHDNLYRFNLMINLENGVEVDKVKRLDKAEQLLNRWLDKAATKEVLQIAKDACKNKTALSNYYYFNGKDVQIVKEQDDNQVLVMGFLNHDTLTSNYSMLNQDELIHDMPALYGDFFAMFDVYYYSSVPDAEQELRAFLGQWVEGEHLNAIVDKVNRQDDALFGAFQKYLMGDNKMLIVSSPRFDKYLKIYPVDGIDYLNGVYMPSGVELSEFKGPTQIDFSAVLNYQHPIEAQFQDTEKFLDRWVTGEVKEKIVTLMRAKTEREGKVLETFKANGKTYQVLSHPHDILMTVRGY